MKRTALMLGLVVLLMVTSMPAAAATPVLRSWVFPNGGGRMSSGSIAVFSTIGLWHRMAAGAGAYPSYLPLLLRK